MAITTTILGRTIEGDKRITFGTYSASAGTAAATDVGLSRVDFAYFQTGGNAVQANMPAVVSTLPYDGKILSVRADNGDTGYFLAIGF